MEEPIAWRLEVTASADVRPGTPEEKVIAAKRAAYAKAHGMYVFDPETPAAGVDPAICRKCYIWAPSTKLPDVYAWALRGVGAHAVWYAGRHPLKSLLRRWKANR